MPPTRSCSPCAPRTPKANFGELVFFAVGCAFCHVPTLVTGDNAVEALDHKAFHPYSDFLLHDMGALGDGIVQGQASGRDMRTAPLWGLRSAGRLLHDGIATRREFSDPPSGYTGLARVPVDLTYNLGLRFDTSVGGATIAFSNLLGLLPAHNGVRQ